MKIIFLDIDGVLNKMSDYDVYCRDHQHLNLRLIDNLNSVINNTNSKLVLSSTWRLLSKNVKLLESVGLTFYGSTDNMGHCRGDEIQRWLDSHNHVKNYIILDDDSDMLESQLPHFVLTDRLSGLNETATYRSTYMLNNKSLYRKNE